MFINHTQLADVTIHMGDVEGYPHHNSKTLISPKLNLVFAITDVLILIPLCYLHYLVKCMVRREKEKKGLGLIKKILTCYSIIVPLVFIFCFTYVDIILNITSPPCKILGDWFCHGYGIFAYAGAMYVGAFSLFTAAVKYWFIVNNANAKRFGEDRAINISLALYLTIPIVMAIFNSISTGSSDQNMWVNFCWKKIEEVLHNETQPVKSDFFCNDRKYEIEKYVGSQASLYITPILRTICAGMKIIYLAFFSNSVEIIIYALIFRYLNR